MSNHPSDNPNIQHMTWISHKEGSLLKLERLTPWYLAQSTYSPIMGVELQTRKHMRVQGSYIRCKWSHIPITFTQDYLQLKDYQHNDVMVITYVIKGFVIHNVLVDTSSKLDIIFIKAFRQIQEPEDKLQDAVNPLCGLG